MGIEDSGNSMKQMLRGIDNEMGWDVELPYFLFLAVFSSSIKQYD